MIHNGFKSARPLARLKQGRSDWYRIENKSGAKASIYIYDEIGYVGVSAQDFVRDLQEVKATEIDLHLDTPGGDVFDGIAIYNAIKDHPAHVNVIVDALAASAGSFILQAGDTRIMNRNSQVMIHDAHGLVVGNAKDMGDMVALLDKASNNIASIYAERSGGTVEQWREVMKNEAWYSAEEAVGAGLADEAIVSSEKVAANDFDLSVFSYAGRDEAPAPVVPAVVAEKPEESPVADDWTQFQDALKGAFA